MAIKNGGSLGGGGGGSVNSVGAGFGLEFDSSSTSTNPVLRTKQTTTDFTSASNRALLDSVTLASGVYRTLADTNNPANAGVEDWIVSVNEADSGQGSTQFWSRCTSTPKLFVRSVDTNSVYGSFVEITGQGGSSALIFSQRNPRQLFSTSAVSSGNTTVTFGVDVTGLYTCQVICLHFYPDLLQLYSL